MDEVISEMRYEMNGCTSGIVDFMVLNFAGSKSWVV